MAYGIVNVGDANELYYGSCSVSGSTAAKTVTIKDFLLETGKSVHVKFSNTNTASSPTLNVSSSGAKQIRYKGASVAPNMIKANVVYEFSYDGTYWNIVGEQPWEAEEKAQEALDTLAKLLGGKLPDPVLANNSPAVIQSVAKLGLGANFWNVGDKTSAITLNGKITDALTFSSETAYAYILGFNHNPTIEGGNSIHFQFGKTSSNTSIAFVDGGYNNYYSSNASARFVMNSTSTNANGWSGSLMRTEICPAFFNALPEEWRNIIAPCTKYSDNTGGGKNEASYITATEDNIWLLAEYEVHGSRTYANSAEQNYQQQYAYFKNGNSKVKYRHSSTGSTCLWWLRSVYASGSNSFCYVSGSGGADYYNAYYSRGFAPGFKVA